MGKSGIIGYSVVVADSLEQLIIRVQEISRRNCRPEGGLQVVPQKHEGPNVFKFYQAVVYCPEDIKAVEEPKLNLTTNNEITEMIDDLAKHLARLKDLAKHGSHG